MLFMYDIIAAITADHKAYIWGSGEAGQIGNEKLQAATLPQELKVLRSQKIRQISFGNGHVVALTRDGAIYTWGKNEHGQLGQGKKLPKQSYKPLLVPGLQGKVIKQVSTIPNCCFFKFICIFVYDINGYCASIGGMW
jgi:alpha-tubulin suppressor-like RCC1 family protein